MKATERQRLVNGLDLKNFNLDFKAKADLGGGFECNIFSNNQYVVIVTGKAENAKKGGKNKSMEYSHYFCEIGDDRYLTDFIESFLESMDIIRNPGLLTGEYGSMLNSLISKVNSYGIKDAEQMNSPLKNCSLDSHLW